MSILLQLCAPVSVHSGEAFPIFSMCWWIPIAWVWGNCLQEIATSMVIDMIARGK